MKITIKNLFILLFSLIALLNGCQSVSEAASVNEQVVVVYTSVDQPFSEPILVEFERQTGIKVKAVYDVEAAKTTGLVNRLIAEKSSPRADVFWNSEIIQTMVLKENGVLAAYVSPQAEGLPQVYRHPQGYWAGVASRARVILVNTERVPNPHAITSIYDLLDPKWQGQDVGIAFPLFGTTATHAAALYAAFGPQDARSYFQALVARGVQVVNGNSVVRDLVANGTLAFGLTDTDDACGALARGAPVAIILPDQDEMGTLVIPGSVALIAGGPHLEEGRALIDYLLSVEVERALIDADFSHIPLHTGVDVPETCIRTKNIRAMDVDFSQVYAYLQQVQTELREIFLR